MKQSFIVNHPGHRFTGLSKFLGNLPNTQLLHFVEMLNLVPYRRFHESPPCTHLNFDGSTLRKVPLLCRSCLVSCSIDTHRPQRCTGSASAAGSRLVSSHFCTPGSRESASDKAPKGVSCLISCPDEFPQRITSFAHATA